MTFLKHGSFHESELELISRYEPAPTINLGDLVRLSSGSPVMLVMAIGNNTAIALLNNGAAYEISINSLVPANVNNQIISDWFNNNKFELS